MRSDVENVARGKPGDMRSGVEMSRELDLTDLNVPTASRSVGPPRPTTRKTKIIITQNIRAGNEIN